MAVYMRSFSLKIVSGTLRTNEEDIKLGELFFKAKSNSNHIQKPIDLRTMILHHRILNLILRLTRYIPGQCFPLHLQTEFQHLTPLWDHP